MGHPSTSGEKLKGGENKEIKQKHLETVREGGNVFLKTSFFYLKISNLSILLWGRKSTKVM